ncbi:MAG: MmcQ/YjbR family DNA-binding protein [Acidimicrobiales bacterium]
MTSLEEARALALALPETTETAHHGMMSFRIRGKIFATVPDVRNVRAMVDDEETRALAASEPGVYTEWYWGKRLACVQIELASVTSEALREVLVDAWRRKAPKRLAKEHGL